MLAWVVTFSLPLGHSVLHPHLCASSPVMLFLFLTSLPLSLLTSSIHASPVTCYEVSRRPSPLRSATYKMLFPQLLCFEIDPSFMGGVHPLNEEIMNSTIANSSSTIDIPAVTSRNDSPLPGAPKEGRCHHIFPTGKHSPIFPSRSL